MSALIHVLTTLNLFATGILVGALVFEYFVVVPVLQRLPTTLSAQIHGAMLGHLPDRFMPVSGLTSGTTAIALAAIGWHQPASATALYAVGLTFGATLLVSTARFSLPVNRQIAGWAVGDVPPEYPAMRRYWDRLHAFRTSCGLVALACYASAAAIQLQ
jgi:hypothetical protein